jgi:hypothetical protein
MRWFEPTPIQPGQTRVVRKFLYLPRTFGRDSRWWEYANIVEKVVTPSRDTWEEIDFEDNRTQAITQVENNSPIPLPTPSPTALFGFFDDIVRGTLTFFGTLYDFFIPSPTRTDTSQRQLKDCKEAAAQWAQRRGGARIALNSIPDPIRNDMPQPLLAFLRGNKPVPTSEFIDELCRILDAAKRNAEINNYLLTNPTPSIVRLTLKTKTQTLEFDFLVKPYPPRPTTE